MSNPHVIVVGDSVHMDAKPIEIPFYTAPGSPPPPKMREPYGRYCWDVIAIKDTQFGEMLGEPQAWIRCGPTHTLAPVSALRRRPRETTYHTTPQAYAIVKGLSDQKQVEFYACAADPLAQRTVRVLDKRAAAALDLLVRLGLGEYFDEASFRLL